MHRIDSTWDVEVACVSIFSSQGSVLARHHQDRFEACRVLVNSSRDPMSAMGGSGGGECFAPICAEVSRGPEHSIVNFFPNSVSLEGSNGVSKDSSV